MSLKAIVLETKRKLFANRAGLHSSIFKGEGLEFFDLKEYNSSDSIRRINWKKSTKNQIVANTFADDRELNIVLVLINSGSLEFGAKKQSAIKTLAALSAAAIESKESLSVLFFNDAEQKFLKPTKRKSAIGIIYETAKTVKYQGGADFEKLNRELLNRVKRNSIIFLIGDFLQEVNLHPISKINEVYALIIRDRAEEDLKLLGELNILDLNSNIAKELTINKSSQKVYNQMMHEHDFRLFEHFKSCQILYSKIYSQDEAVNNIGKMLSL